ncbi:45354_t:CDS:2 [Gigaspora margarita]|uniref:45354_t:CDS:1 n=1 Tax=Gigaspora margarita TaxID=4874 RepID=A0ABN7UK70_GIGMA|nr:45354_t:CDS:2 [Gigaspora margarita]
MDKRRKEKERNEETREMLRDNEFINAWEIIKEANKSEPWTNFDTYEEYITQTKKQSIAQILKAKEYFAKELIRIIVKNWKYEYPREQFEETEENITDLMIKKHESFELSNLRAKIRLAKNECLQHYLSILKIRRLKKIVQPPTKKELREKMNNIFDKPLKKGILKNLNQDPYTSKSTPLRVQLLTRYEVEFTEAKLPFNKSYEPTNISPFNEPLFNQLTLMEHLEESLYIRIAANKKNQLTEGQYQDWQQQMFQKIEKQYNTLYNEGRQFSLKNIMKNQIKEGYNNLHEMLNHDQLKLNFITIDGAIAVEKTTTCHWLKTWLQSYEQNVILREEITLQHKDLLKMFYANPEKYGFALLEGKIPNRTYIIEDRTVYSTQFFTEEIITNQEEKEKLNQQLQHSTFKLLPNKMNYTIFCDQGQEQMLQWFKKRSKEGNKGTDRQIPKEYLIKIYNRYKEMIKQVHPNYIRINNNIPNLEHILNVTIYPNQFETLGGNIEETDKGIFEEAKRECKEETSYEPEDKRIQLILNHQYLSINKNGTKLFVKGLHEYTQVEKRIQIYTFLYYVYPKEYTNFINNEPDKASTRKWMTPSEMKHKLFTPTIHYYKEEIFKKYIPAYWEEFTRKGSICTKSKFCKEEMIY